MKDIHKRIFTSKVPGHEGDCKASHIVDNQVVQRLDGGVSGWFRKVEKRRRWYFLFLLENYKMVGPEFHGIVYFGTNEVVPTDPDEEVWDDEDDELDEVLETEDDDIVDTIVTAAVAGVVIDTIIDDEVESIEMELDEFPDDYDVGIYEYPEDFSEVDDAIVEQISEREEYVEIDVPGDEPLYVEPEPIVDDEPVYVDEPEPIVEPEPEPVYEPEPEPEDGDD